MAAEVGVNASTPEVMEESSNNDVLARDGIFIVQTYILKDVFEVVYLCVRYCIIP